MADPEQITIKRVAQPAVPAIIEETTVEVTFPLFHVEELDSYEFSDDYPNRVETKVWRWDADRATLITRVVHGSEFTIEIDFGATRLRIPGRAVPVAEDIALVLGTKHEKFLTDDWQKYAREQYEEIVREAKEALDGTLDLRS